MLDQHSCLGMAAEDRAPSSIFPWLPCDDLYLKFCSYVIAITREFPYDRGSAMAAELEFKKGLYKISSHFSRSEVDKLKFILSDFIPRRKLERASSAFHVFCLLESHDNLLNRHDLAFFKEILDEVHKGHFIQQYLSNPHPKGLPLATAQV